MTRPRMIMILCCALIASCENTKVDDGRRFRRITAADYCSSTVVFARPSAEYEVGQLFAECKNYVDPLTREKSHVIKLRGRINGSLRGLWRRKSELDQWYVAEGSEPETCRWIVEEEVPPTSLHEIHASETLIPAGRSTWQVDRKTP